jgi:hypothetical protein
MAVGREPTGPLQPLAFSSLLTLVSAMVTVGLAFYLGVYNIFQINKRAIETPPFLSSVKLYDE